MAYREFHDEPLYKAPEIADPYQKTFSVMETLLKHRLAQQQNNKALAATYQADKLASKFTTDQEDLHHLSAANTNLAVSDISRNGQVSQQTRQALARAQGIKATSDAQWQMFSNLEKEINDRAVQNPYYDKTYDMADLNEQAYGRNDEHVDWNNRSERLQKFQARMGSNPLAFKAKQYTDDYVTKLGLTEKTEKTKYPSGNEESNTTKAYFRNKDGVPEVTPEHATEYIDSSPQVKAYYKAKVDAEIVDDLRQNASPEVQKEIADFGIGNVVRKLREDPSYKIKGKTPGELENDIARQELVKRNRVSENNSHDFSGSTPEGQAKSKGLTSDTYTVEQSAFDKNKYGGPGMVFVNKKSDTGKGGLPIDIHGTVFDKNDNKSTGNIQSTRKAFIQSANVGLWDVRNNKPVDLAGNDVDEKIASMEKMPDHFFKDVDAKTLIHGKSYNSRDLESAQQELKVLQLKPEDLLTDDERGRKGTLENTLNELKVNPDLSPEIVQGALGVVVSDLVKPIDSTDPDAKQIKAKLGSFDVTDPKKWDPDQVKFYNAFTKRKNEAIATKFGAVEKTKQWQDNVRQIQESSNVKPAETPHPEVEQGGNIFTWDPAKKKYVFSRKK